MKFLMRIQCVFMDKEKEGNQSIAISKVEVETYVDNAKNTMFKL